MSGSRLSQIVAALKLPSVDSLFRGGPAPKTNSGKAADKPRDNAGADMLATKDGQRLATVWGRLTHGQRRAILDLAESIVAAGRKCGGLSRVDAERSNLRITRKYLRPTWPVLRLCWMVRGLRLPAPPSSVLGRKWRPRRWRPTPAGPSARPRRLERMMRLMLEFRDKGTSATQFAVMSGEVVIASLYKGTLSVTAGQAIVWNWSFKTTEGPPGFQQHGSASSFEEAKAAIEERWALWLDAAGLREV